MVHIGWLRNFLMGKHKETLILGFALFSMFFGAGNLILPPYLGVKAGNTWGWVTLGFFVTAVVIPILGIFAHARLHGTMYDFGKKVSPTFSTVYCIIVYAVAIALPAPRTASVTHEMAIQPFFGSSSLLTSAIYFFLVCIFAINRSKVLHLLGKFLTPLIIIILCAVICIGLFSPGNQIVASSLTSPFIDGVLEGYQTFDAIGAIVVGGVLVISMNYNRAVSFQSKKDSIRKAGFIAGFGLLAIYAGLIYNGALFGSTFETEATRTEILAGLSMKTLGSIGNTFLSVLVALACFTTAVGIVTGTSDYIKGVFNESHTAYLITALVSSILGVVIGQFDVQYIIVVALPALMFIYPITIVLILLNVLPEKLTSPLIFKSVVGITFICSIPDFLKFIVPEESLSAVQKFLPFSEQSLGWVLPAFFTFILVNILLRLRKA
jgi:branched-chain amino acid:cation transporter, LIVCS family